MKYIIIALAIVAVLIVIRGAGGDQPAQLSYQLQGPPLPRYVVMPIPGYNYEEGVDEVYLGDRLGPPGKIVTIIDPPGGKIIL